MSMNMESLTASRFLDEDCLDQGKELFGHHGVIYHNTNMSDDETPGTGSLSVVQYAFGKCIEWKASEQVCVDADSQEQEWAMVNATRRRTISGSLDTLGSRTSLRLPLSEIKGYKVEQKKTRLTIVPKDNKISYIFYFQYGNSDGLTQILKSFITSKRSKQDKKFYVIVGEKNNKTVPKSFSDLTLSERPDTVWNFVSNLKDKPYETTLSTFSKFSDYLLFRPPDCRQSDDEEVVGDLASSMEASAANEGAFSLLCTTTPRPAPPRGSPLNAAQWAAAIDPQGRIINPENIKQIIFRGGCEQSLRFDVWKFLLDYYPWHSTLGERLELKKQKVEYYFRMKLQWKSLSPEQETRFSAFRERKNLIEKDVYRTDRTMEFFAGDANPNLALLSDILTTYAMYNFDLGYVQGMSDLLSPILFLMGNEVDAFWCFVGFMDKVYRNFDEDQAGMKKQLSQLGTLLSAAEPELSEYLDQKESGNLFFCFRWLLVWFKREFSYQDIMTLWEVLWTGLPCTNFHLVICVAILESEKKILIERNYGFTEILKHFNELSGKLEVDNLLSRAEGVYLSLCSATDRLTAATRRVVGLSSTPATTSSEEEQDDPPSHHDAILENAFEQSLSLYL